MTDPTAVAPQNIVPVPPEPESLPDSLTPRLSRDGSAMILEGNPELPTNICIRSGKPASKELTMSLRNPRNPLTWFGKRPTITIGLCRKNYENRAVAVTLTWSVLAIGGILLLVGLTTLSLFSALIGLIAVCVSGVFRASFPLTSPDASGEYATVYGVSDRFLSQLPAYEAA